MTSGILAWNHGSQYGVVNLQKSPQKGGVPMVIEITYNTGSAACFPEVGLSQVVTNGSGFPLPPDGCLRVIFSLRPFALQMQIDKFPLRFRWNQRPLRELHDPGFADPRNMDSLSRGASEPN